MDQFPTLFGREYALRLFQAFPCPPVHRRRRGLHSLLVRIPSVSEVAERKRDPFRILVSTMISLRTKDEVTAAASQRLLAHAPTAQQLARLKQQDIAELICPAGFCNTKAKNMKGMARKLVSQYGGLVPASMEQLLELPGVDRKTANLVRNLGYGLDGICVDTHVHRISNRLGWVQTKTPV